MSDRTPFSTHNFALVVCRNVEGKWLAIKETRNRGWWLPAGLVEPGETFIQAAQRETLKEAGIKIDLRGILRIEHSVYGPSHARMRVIFYGTPVDRDAPIKKNSDDISEEARWVTIDELKRLSRQPPGLRGPELYEWGLYLERGGFIAPLNFLCREDEPTPGIQSQFFQIDQSETAKISMTNFIQAIEQSNDRVIYSGILSGLNLNLPINNKCWTPLHLSCKLAYENATYLLLQGGGDPALVTHKKRNVLHVAVQTTPCIVNMILIQISRRIDKQSIVNMQDDEGMTPLHYAAALKGRSEIWELLIIHGADENLRNFNGDTPKDMLDQYQ